MSRRRWWSFLIAFCWVLGLPLTAFAEGGAEALLKQKQGELTAELKKGKAADEKKIAKVFDELLDYDTLAKDSLGQYWDERSDDEKKDFQDLLKRLVRNAYRKNLKKTLGYEVQYNGESAAKKGTLVQTVAKNKTNPREEPISIDYLLHQVDGAWKVEDLITEGSSLVGGYRSQFTKVIKSKGFAELMRKMKRKADKEKI
jgi:phospholipid transport system substrate-binding protein